MKEPVKGLFKTSLSWKGKIRKYKLPKVSKSNFEGEIYVLVNGASFSAASSLARYLKEYSNATIIGEEGGGRYEGFVAGSKQHLSLPNSQIKLAIPRYLNYFPKSQKQTTSNRGIIPDYEVKHRIQDYIKGTDPVKSKALSMALNRS